MYSTYPTKRLVSADNLNDESYYTNNSNTKNYTSSTTSTTGTTAASLLVAHNTSNSKTHNNAYHTSKLLSSEGGVSDTKDNANLLTTTATDDLKALKEELKSLQAQGRRGRGGGGGATAGSGEWGLGGHGGEEGGSGVGGGGGGSRHGLMRRVRGGGSTTNNSSANTLLSSAIHHPLVVSSSSSHMLLSSSVASSSPLLHPLHVAGGGESGLGAGAGLMSSSSFGGNGMNANNASLGVGVGGKTYLFGEQIAAERSRLLVESRALRQAHAKVKRPAAAVLPSRDGIFSLIDNNSSNTTYISPRDRLPRSPSPTATSPPLLNGNKKTLAGAPLSESARDYSTSALLRFGGQKGGGKHTAGRRPADAVESAAKAAAHLLDSILFNNSNNNSNSGNTSEQMKRNQQSSSPSSRSHPKLGEDKERRSGEGGPAVGQNAQRVAKEKTASSFVQATVAAADEAREELNKELADVGLPLHEKVDDDDRAQDQVGQRRSQLLPYPAPSSSSAHSIKTMKKSGSSSQTDPYGQRRTEEGSDVAGQRSSDDRGMRILAPLRRGGPETQTTSTAFSSSSSSALRGFEARVAAKMAMLEEKERRTAQEAKIVSSGTVAIEERVLSDGFLLKPTAQENEQQRLMLVKHEHMLARKRVEREERERERKLEKRKKKEEKIDCNESNTNAFALIEGPNDRAALDSMENQKDTTTTKKELRQGAFRPSSSDAASSLFHRDKRGNKKEESTPAEQMASSSRLGRGNNLRFGNAADEEDNGATKETSDAVARKREARDPLLFSRSSSSCSSSLSDISETSDLIDGEYDVDPAKPKRGGGGAVLRERDQGILSRTTSTNSNRTHNHNDSDAGNKKNVHIQLVMRHVNLSVKETKNYVSSVRRKLLDVEARAEAALLLESAFDKAEKRIASEAVAAEKHKKALQEARRVRAVELMALTNVDPSFVLAPEEIELLNEFKKAEEDALAIDAHHDEVSLWSKKRKAGGASYSKNKYLAKRERDVTRIQSLARGRRARQDYRMRRANVYKHSADRIAREEAELREEPYHDGEDQQHHELVTNSNGVGASSSDALLSVGVDEDLALELAIREAEAVLEEQNRQLSRYYELEAEALADGAASCVQQWFRSVRKRRTEAAMGCITRAVRTFWRRKAMHEAYVNQRHVLASKVVTSSIARATAVANAEGCTSK